MLLPYMTQIICNVWHAMTSWSINWELGIKSLSCFATFETLFALESQIQWRSFERAMVSHSIVQAKSTFDIFGFSDSGCNRVNSTPYIILSADASRVCVAHKTVTLLCRIEIWLSNSWEQVNSLIIRLLCIFINVVSLMQWETRLSLTP